MPNEQAKAFIDQATKELQNGDYAKALELVDQAIEIDGNFSDHHVLRGICLSQLDRPDDATAAFRKAITLSPYNPKAYYNLAVHQHALGHTKEALELAREAVGVDPRHQDARKFVSQLEFELAGPGVAPRGARDAEANPHDPLSMPPPPGVGLGQAPPAPNQPSAGQAAPNQPPGGQSPTGPAAPGVKPPASGYAPPVSERPAGGNPQNPYTMQATYAKPGYDEPAHSIPWVGNMGGGWTAIGWLIWLLCLATPIIAFAMVGSAIGTAFSGDQAGFQDKLHQLGSTAPAFQVLYLASGLLCLGWTVIDILDRRANFWWIAPLVVCGCGMLNGLTMLIYLAAGRKTA